MLLFAAGCSTRGVYHTVEKGETLYRIAHTYGVDERDLARRNGISDPTQLRIGQRIFIPGAEQPRPLAAVPSRSPSPVAPQTRVATKPAPSAPVSGKTRDEVPASPVDKHRASPPAAAVKGKFAWPLQGKILREFGTRGNRMCNGVEISASEGTPVHAAAAGRVTYSGNGIQGYGHLVIIRHGDSYFTVYGYNRKNLVETGSFVSQGERIALSGKPPSGGAPRLHFEVRRGKDAVDPFFYLP